MLLKLKLRLIFTNVLCVTSHLLPCKIGFLTYDSFKGVIQGFMFSAELTGVETHSTSSKFMCSYKHHKERLKVIDVAVQALPINNVSDPEIPGVQQVETETINNSP